MSQRLLSGTLQPTFETVVTKMEWINHVWNTVCKVPAHFGQHYTYFVMYWIVLYVVPLLCWTMTEPDISSITVGCFEWTYWSSVPVKSVDIKFCHRRIGAIECLCSLFRVCALFPAENVSPETGYNYCELLLCYCPPFRGSTSNWATIVPSAYSSPPVIRTVWGRRRPD